MRERPPEPTELIYVPEPSAAPALAAAGIAGIIAGIIVWFPYGIAGAIVALVALRQMIRSARHDLERLPRRQRLATAVLPAIPPRRAR